MTRSTDPSAVHAADAAPHDFLELTRRPVAEVTAPAASLAVTARLHGFGLDEQPLIADLAELPGEVVRAAAIVPLRRSQIDGQVLVVFERGDIRRPIIVGVLQSPAPEAEAPGGPRTVSVQSDDERLVLSAEREIVLRCGDASITLTRAGKVILRGTYVVSRSTGYNRIKGAVVDIN